MMALINLVMGVFFFVSSLMLFIFVFFSIFGKDLFLLLLETSNQDKCTNHNWITHEQGFMYCSRCGVLAGNIDCKIEKETEGK